MAIVQRLGETTSLVERRLAELLSTHGPGEGRASARPCATRCWPVKRFRPFLVIESGALFGLSAAQTTTAAAAIECIHCYSLVHDDLPSMDNDDVRRERPTVHKAYDEWTAILVGDALLTMAFVILADLQPRNVAKPHSQPSRTFGNFNASRQERLLRAPAR